MHYGFGKNVTTHPLRNSKFFPSCQPIPHLRAHGKRQFPIPELSVILDLIPSRENGLILSDPLDITESDDPPYFTKVAAFRARFFTGGRYFEGLRGWTTLQKNVATKPFFCQKN